MRRNPDFKWPSGWTFFRIMSGLCLWVIVICGAVGSTLAILADHHTVGSKVAIIGLVNGSFLLVGTLATAFLAMAHPSEW